MQAFGDPPAILCVLDDWLKTIPMLETFLSYLDYYITSTIRANENGYFWSILVILAISFSFFLFALLCFVSFTFVIRKKYICCSRAKNVVNS